MLLAAAAMAATLTLREAVSEALARSPQATAAKARQEAARAQQQQARAAWLPKIDVTETAVRSDDPVFVFAGLLQQGRFGPANFDPAYLNAPPPLQSFRAALNVRYTFFDQLRRFDAGASARNAVDQADAGYDETRQRLRLDTLSRFYGIALAEAKHDVAGEAVRAAEAQAATMRDKSQQGLLVQSDLLATEVQLAEFRQQQIEAEGELAVARAALATLLQRPATGEVAIEGALPTRSFPEVDIDQAVAKGVATRGSVTAASAAARDAQLDLRTARGSFLPRLDGMASWSATGSTLGRRNPDHLVGVVASLDLFDGGKFARVAAARAGLEGARAAESGARDAVTMEVIGAWHRARAARLRVEVAAKAVEQAESAARIVGDRYEHGLTTITEQLRANTALVRARLGLLAARYDALVGYAELLRATGGLNDVDAFL